MRNKRTSLFSLLAAIIFIAIGYGIVHALPYAPGETLDPSCHPGDTNCTVLVATTTPAGSDGQIQFNNSGAFGASANLTFHPAIGPVGQLFLGGPSLDPFSGDPIDFTRTTLAVGATVVDTNDSPPRTGVLVNLTVNSPVDSITSFTSLYSNIAIPSTNSSNFSNVVGTSSTAIHNGSGTVTQLYGSSVDVENNGSGAVTIGWGYDSGVFGSGFTTVYNFYAHDLAGVAANPYYSWFDSRGVRRVKEDSTFNGVGQAIEALYNPQFTKYTPGATNYERVILGQWNSNVAEIGTAAGGTGTLRPLRLLGSSVLIPSNVGIGTTTPVANFQVANGSNATTTVEFGTAGQNKGTCLKLYRSDGSAIYASVAAGATTFTLSTTACATVTGF